MVPIRCPVNIRTTQMAFDSPFDLGGVLGYFGPEQIFKGGQTVVDGELVPLHLL